MQDKAALNKLLIPLGKKIDEVLEGGKSKFKQDLLANINKLTINK